MRTGLERATAAAHVPARPFRGASSGLEASSLGLSAVASLERIVASEAWLAVTEEGGPQKPLVAIKGIIDRSKPGTSMPPGEPGERFRRTDPRVPAGAKPGEPVVAVAGTRWMLIGNRTSQMAVLGGNGGPADARLIGIEARLEPDAEVWLVTPDAARRGTEILAGSLRKMLRDMELPVLVQRGLRAQALLAGDSPELERTQAGMLQPGSSSGPGRSVRGWTVSRSGQEAAGATSDLLAADLDRGVEKARASALAIGRLAFRSILSGGSVSAAAELRADAAQAALPEAEPEAPLAPRLLTIRIAGLDEGPREIPYATAHHRRPSPWRIPVGAPAGSAPCLTPHPRPPCGTRACRPIGGAPEPRLARVPRRMRTAPCIPANSVICRGQDPAFGRPTAGLPPRLDPERHGPPGCEWSNAAGGNRV